MARKLLAFGLVLSAGLALSTLVPLPAGRLRPEPVVSFRILDRDGVLLREVLSDAGGRCRWVTLDDVSPFLINATIAAEDRFFYFHRGVDGLSAMRAAWQNLRHGRVVSGASTISQQVVRNIYPGRRTIGRKLVQSWLALRLERTLPKSGILAQYFNRISYGNQAFGIEAAARLYFDKPAAQLSLAEAALLAAIPRSPSVLNPYRSTVLLRNKQQQIIRSMAGLGFVNVDEARRALAEPWHVVSRQERFKAPHFCDYILGRLPDEERSGLAAVVTTLDSGLQEKLEAMLKRYLDGIRDRGITNGALVVLDNRTGELRALVGSRDYFDEANAGQVNGALALRQPGSALKPFTYALALEKGLTAGSIVEDAPFRSAAGGAYMPQNYDRKYHGPMSLRSALACSYNVPAVALLDAVGPDLLLRRLNSLGLSTLSRSPGHYGVGLTLGNGEVKLLELSGAYAALARSGRYRPVQPVLEWRTTTGGTVRPEAPPETSVFSPQVAYVITDILADRDARVPSFGYNTSLSLPFPAAAKTGTSKDFRDNWTVGFTPDWTVGIWVGDFGGRPMHGVSGITGCGPLFRDIMLLLNRGGEWAGFAAPAGISRISVCPQSGALPGAGCPGAVEEVFIRGTEPSASCGLHRRGNLEVTAPTRGGDARRPLLEVSFPVDGDIFRLDPVLRQEHQRILLKAAVPEGVKPDSIEWWINGRKAGETAYPYSMFWNLRPGSFTIMAAAVRNGHRTESVPVRIVVLS